MDTVADGAQAWTRLDDKPEFYDVLVLDLRMPYGFGIHLVRQVRQDVRLQTMPIVLLAEEPDDWDSYQSWKARPLPYVWGDETWELYRPMGEPFEDHTVYVHKNKRPAVLAAVTAVQARYPRAPR